MPSRTIYLPDDVDRMVSDLNVNLSRLTQDAIRALADEQRADRQSRLDEIRRRVLEANISYPTDHLQKMREAAGDDLR